MIFYNDVADDRISVAKGKSTDWIRGRKEVPLLLFGSVNKICYCQLQNPDRHYHHNLEASYTWSVPYQLISFKCVGSFVKYVRKDLVSVTGNIHLI